MSPLKRGIVLKIIHCIIVVYVNTSTMRLFIVFFLLISVSVFGRQSDSDLLEVHKAYDRAVELKDSLALKKIFHPNMVITGGNGLRRSVGDEIKDCIDPRYPVVYFRTLNIETRMFDKTAVLLGDLEWQFKNGDKPTTLKRRVTFTYTQVKGEWVMVAMHIGTPPKS